MTDTVPLAQHVETQEALGMARTCNGYRGPLETYVCDRDCRIDYTEMTACTCRRNNGYGCDLHGIPFTAEADR